MIALINMHELQGLTAQQLGELHQFFTWLNLPSTKRSAAISWQASKTSSARWVMSPDRRREASRCSPDKHRRVRPRSRPLAASEAVCISLKYGFIGLELNKLSLCAEFLHQRLAYKPPRVAYLALGPLKTSLFHVPQHQRALCIETMRP